MQDHVGERQKKWRCRMPKRCRRRCECRQLPARGDVMVNDRGQPEDMSASEFEDFLDRLKPSRTQMHACRVYTLF